MNKVRAIYEEVFHPPKADELARRELESAKRSLLTNLTHKEYYSAQVDFDRQRIKRLEDYLK